MLKCLPTIAFILLFALISSCDLLSPPEPPTPLVLAKIMQHDQYAFETGDYTRYSAEIYICNNAVIEEGVNHQLSASGDENIKDATVLLNGITLPFDNSMRRYRLYELILHPGEHVELKITHPDISIDILITVPEAVEISSPTDGSLSPGDEVPLAWNTLSPTPDELWAAIDVWSTITNIDDYTTYSIPPESTSYTIPSGIFGTDDRNGYKLSMFTINRTFLTSYASKKLDSNSQIYIQNRVHAYYIPHIVPVP